ncbi:MAG: 3-oxoacyl-[acyl-carrier-protein] synthase III C-terminal domain-containing protein [Sedimentisphaerales bacterium]|jgi:predicted naringenin-chalcone synthase
MNAAIKSLATATGPKKITQERIYQFLSTRLELKGEEERLYEKILLGGPIKTRHFGLDTDEHILLQEQDQLIERFLKYSRLIATQAVRKALTRARLGAGDVGCLVINTCTGYLCPGLSSYLVEDLCLDSSVKVVDIAGMGCGAAIPNLECAARMTPADGRVALSVAVEICSATIVMGPEPDLAVSNSIFADGASAAVVARTRGNDPGRIATLLDFESLVLPKEREHLRYRSVHGKLRNTLSRRVPVIAARSCKEVVSRLLDRHKLDKRQIAFWAVHPGGSRVLERILKELELPAGTLDHSYRILRDYGNMSSPSVMFVLERIWQRNKPKRGQKCLLLSFGAGFTAFAALAEF